MHFKLLNEEGKEGRDVWRVLQKGTSQGDLIINS